MGYRLIPHSSCFTLAEIMTLRTPFAYTQVPYRCFRAADVVRQNYTLMLALKHSHLFIIHIACCNIIFSNKSEIRGKCQLYVYVYVPAVLDSLGVLRMLDRYSATVMILRFQQHIGFTPTEATERDVFPELWYISIIIIYYHPPARPTNTPSHYCPKNSVRYWQKI